METQQLDQKETTRCAICNKTLTTFMAYIPGKGEFCLNCFTNVQADEKL